MSHLTEKQRTALMLQQAQGQMAVLAVGVGKYDKSSGFNPLDTCVNDAHTVCDVFRDVWQLNADKTRIWPLTSERGFPSKGEILKAVRRLAEDERREDFGHDANVRSRRTLAAKLETFIGGKE